MADGTFRVKGSTTGNYYEVKGGTIEFKDRNGKKMEQSAWLAAENATLAADGTVRKKDNVDANNQVKHKIPGSTSKRYYVIVNGKREFHNEDGSVMNETDFFAAENSAINKKIEKPQKKESLLSKAWSATKAFGKGAIKTLGNMVGNYDENGNWSFSGTKTLKTLGTAALITVGAAALVGAEVLTAGQVTWLLVGAGALMGTMTVGKGVVQYSNANTREEKLAAIETMGGGTAEIGLSFLMRGMKGQLSTAATAGRAAKMEAALSGSGRWGAAFKGGYAGVKAMVPRRGTKSEGGTETTADAAQTPQTPQGAAPKNGVLQRGKDMLNPSMRNLRSKIDNAKSPEAFRELRAEVNNQYGVGTRENIKLNARIDAKMQKQGVVDAQNPNPNVSTTTTTVAPDGTVTTTTTAPTYDAYNARISEATFKSRRFRRAEHKKLKSEIEKDNTLSAEQKAELTAKIDAKKATLDKIKGLNRKSTKADFEAALKEAIEQKDEQLLLTFFEKVRTDQRWVGSNKFNDSFNRTALKSGDRQAMLVDTYKALQNLNPEKYTFNLKTVAGNELGAQVLSEKAVVEGKNIAIERDTNGAMKVMDEAGAEIPKNPDGTYEINGKNFRMEDGKFVEVKEPNVLTSETQQIVEFGEGKFTVESEAVADDAGLLINNDGGFVNYGGQQWAVLRDAQGNVIRPTRAAGGDPVYQIGAKEYVYKHNKFTELDPKEGTLPSEAQVYTEQAFKQGDETFVWDNDASVYRTESGKTLEFGEGQSYTITEGTKVTNFDGNGSYQTYDLANSQGAKLIQSREVIFDKKGGIKETIDTEYFPNERYGLYQRSIVKDAKGNVSEIVERYSLKPGEDGFSTGIILKNGKSTYKAKDYDAFFEKCKNDPEELALLEHVLTKDVEARGRFTGGRRDVLNKVRERQQELIRQDAVAEESVAPVERTSAPEDEIIIDDEVTVPEREQSFDWYKNPQKAKRSTETANKFKKDIDNAETTRDLDILKERIEEDPNMSAQRYNEVSDAFARRHSELAQREYDAYMQEAQDGLDYAGINERVYEVRSKYAQDEFEVYDSEQNANVWKKVSDMTDEEVYQIAQKDFDASVRLRESIEHNNNDISRSLKSVEESEARLSEELRAETDPVKASAKQYQLDLINDFKTRRPQSLKEFDDLIAEIKESPLDDNSTIALIKYITSRRGELELNSRLSLYEPVRNFDADRSFALKKLNEKLDQGFESEADYYRFRQELEYNRQNNLIDDDYCDIISQRADYIYGEGARPQPPKIKGADASSRQEIIADENLTPAGDEFIVPEVKKPVGGAADDAGAVTGQPVQPKVEPYRAPEPYKPVDEVAIVESRTANVNGRELVIEKGNRSVTADGETIPVDENGIFELDGQKFRIDGEKITEFRPDFDPEVIDVATRESITIGDKEIKVNLSEDGPVSVEVDGETISDGGLFKVGEREFKFENGQVVELQPKGAEYNINSTKSARLDDGEYTIEVKDGNMTVKRNGEDIDVVDGKVKIGDREYTVEEAADGTIKVRTSEEPVPPADGVYEIEGNKITIEKDPATGKFKAKNGEEDITVADDGTFEVAGKKYNVRENGADVEVRPEASEVPVENGEITINGRKYKVTKDKVTCDEQEILPDANKIYNIEGKKYVNENGVLKEVTTEPTGFKVNIPNKIKNISGKKLALAYLHALRRFTGATGVLAQEIVIAKETADLISKLEDAAKLQALLDEIQAGIESGWTMQDVINRINQAVENGEISAEVGKQLRDSLLDQLEQENSDVTQEAESDVEEFNPDNLIESGDQVSGNTSDVTPDDFRQRIENAQTEDELDNIIKTLPDDIRTQLEDLINAKREALKGSKSADEPTTVAVGDQNVTVTKDGDKTIVKDSNGNEIKPNDDGTYTIGGKKYNYNDGKFTPVEDNSSSGGGSRVGGGRSGGSHVGDDNSRVRRGGNDQGQIDRPVPRDNVPQGDGTPILKGYFAHPVKAKSKGDEITHKQVTDFVNAIKDATTEEELNQILLDVREFKMFKGRKQLRAAIKARRQELASSDKDYKNKKHVKAEHKLDVAHERFDYAQYKETGEAPDGHAIYKQPNLFQKYILGKKDHIEVKPAKDAVAELENHVDADALVPDIDLNITAKDIGNTAKGKIILPPQYRSIPEALAYVNRFNAHNEDTSVIKSELEADSKIPQSVKDFIINKMENVIFDDNDNDIV